MTDIPILSLIVFLPAAGAGVLLFMRDDRAVRRTALVFAVVDFALTIPLMAAFDTTTYAMQFTETVPWVPSLGITYSLGVDGISLLFIFLTALLGWICVVASWEAKTPGDSLVEVEVRGRDASGRKSSWDSLGRWSYGDKYFSRTSLGSNAHDAHQRDPLNCNDTPAIFLERIEFPTCGSGQRIVEFKVCGIAHRTAPHIARRTFRHLANPT